MLIHAMVFALLLLVFTGTILTQAVVASKLALQTTVTRYLEAAAGDGVADLTGGMQYYVKHAGAAGPWQIGTAESRSARRSACADSTPADECPFTYDIAARVTGATTTGSPSAGGTDVAMNLQSAIIDEQRVSAQVTVRLYEHQSDKVLGSRTRYLTYRVFNSAPYAIVSGVRDGTTVNGLASSAQGDTSGTKALSLQGPGAGDNPAPSTTRPNYYRDSTLKMLVTCSTINDLSRPQAAPGNEGTPWGVNAQGFELPCQVDRTVDKNALINQTFWENGNDNVGGWTE